MADPNEVRQDQERLKLVVQKDPRPLMISRFGAKIMEIGGVWYLVAATPKELATASALPIACISGTSSSHLPRKCCDASLPLVMSGRLSEKY